MLKILKAFILSLYLPVLTFGEFSQYNSTSDLYRNSGIVDGGGHWVYGSGGGSHGGSTNNNILSNGNGGVQSFFNVALTALAFLSFGIFLLNLLTNALMFSAGAGQQGLTSTGPIITVPSGTAGATAGGGGGDEGTFRGKRSILQFDVDSRTAANVLAETVLKSIDAMITEHECLPKIFCNGNKQAKLIGRGFQYLMPIYSISSSFIGEQVGFHNHFPDHLDAILCGVTESNCNFKFSKC